MAEAGSKSKTPSDRSSNSKLLDPPTFFLDRALGKRKVADALRAEDAEVVEEPETAIHCQSNSFRHRHASGCPKALRPKERMIAI